MIVRVVALCIRLSHRAMGVQRLKRQELGLQGRPLLANPKFFLMEKRDRENSSTPCLLDPVRTL